MKTQQGGHAFCSYCLIQRHPELRGQASWISGRRLAMCGVVATMQGVKYRPDWNDCKICKALVKAGHCPNGHWFVEDEESNA